MNLLQIVSTLPPAVDGVGGHAAALARALAAERVRSRFLTALPSEPGAGDLAVTVIAERRGAAFARQLEATGTDFVLLHYVNYGYQRRGCPSWLVGGLARWRSTARERRLVTIFHEVYASGPPWRSSFWLAPIQRHLAARLLRASDAAVTSLELYGRMLGRWQPRRAVQVAPVLSTVGEPAAVPPADGRRSRQLVIFGSAGSRRRAYGRLREPLAHACRALGIDEIVDLGPALGALPERIGDVPVRALGPLAERRLSALLLGSYAGFLGYPPHLLGKSSIFAAYCAHGLVPVCAWPLQRVRARPASEEVPPCWNPCAEETGPGDATALAAQALAWYHGHDAARQARWFRELFTGLAADPREAPAAVADGAPCPADPGVVAAERRKPG